MSAVCSLGFGECTSCPSIDASSPLPPLSFYFEFFQQDFDLNCQILEFDRKQLEAPSLLWLQLLLVNQPNKQRQNTFQIINVFTAQTAWKTLKMNLTFTFSVLCIQLGKTLKLNHFHFLSAVPLTWQNSQTEISLSLSQYCAFNLAKLSSWEFTFTFLVLCIQFGKTLKLNITFTFSVMCIQLDRTLKLNHFHFLSAVHLTLTNKNLKLSLTFSFTFSVLCIQLGKLSNWISRLHFHFLIIN